MNNVFKFHPISASRRGLVEKSSLIRHTSSAKPKRPDNAQPSQIGDRSANAIDSQTLLKDVRNLSFFKWLSNGPY